MFETFEPGMGKDDWSLSVRWATNGRDCRHCRGTGFRGRRMCSEVFSGGMLNNEQTTTIEQLIEQQEWAALTNTWESFQQRTGARGATTTFQGQALALMWEGTLDPAQVLETLGIAQ